MAGSSARVGGCMVKRTPLLRWTSESLRKRYFVGGAAAAAASSRAAATPTITSEPLR